MKLCNGFVKRPILAQCGEKRIMVMASVVKSLYEDVLNCRKGPKFTEGGSALGEE